MVLGGCTLGRLDGLTGGSGIEVPDAGVVEAGVDSSVKVDAGSAPDGGDAGPGVLLFSDSFADAQTCIDTSFNSTLSTSSNGRTDGSACKVCGHSAGPGSFSYSTDVAGAVATVGAHYHATAWYRNPVAGATASSVSFALRSIVSTPTFGEIEVASKSGTIGSDWRRIDVDLVLTKPAQGVDVFLAAPYGPGVCFVFDDLQVTRTD